MKRKPPPTLGPFHRIYEGPEFDIWESDEDSNVLYFTNSSNTHTRSQIMLRSVDSDTAMADLLESL